MLIARKIPQPPPTPFPQVVVRPTLYLGAHMDDDNATARLKWCLDWLKARQFIVDDSRKHLHLLTPHQAISKSKRYVRLAMRRPDLPASPGVL